MSNYIIEITLLSDLCSSNGGIYNASVDTEVCADVHGLPYIPGKRLKGCLRECAAELRDWGKDVDISGMFGEEGDRQGSIRIGNAYLRNYEKITKELEAASGSVLAHPENVLENYTHYRTQTAIDQETGVADDTSLRTMRVVNKGLVFEAEASLTDKTSDDLKDILKLLHHMGVSRTRGFGEVRAALHTGGTTETKPIEIDDGAEVLPYEIELCSPAIIKSTHGQETDSLDYYDGSKILGCIVENIKKGDHLAEFFSDGELKVSNAYLSVDGKRLQEVPASVYSVKNNKHAYRNKLYNEQEKPGIQINAMKHCYVEISDNGDLKKSTVDMEEHYHHRRPEDKGIGRATGKAEDGSVFYQISAIAAGQTFTGFIEGSPAQIAKIAATNRSGEAVCLGAGNSSEYGKCILRFGHGTKKDVSKCKTLSFAVFLKAPAIVYGENASFSTERKDLISALLNELEIPENKIKSKTVFSNTIDVGGYNVTWKMRKPIVRAFDKGSTVAFTTNMPVEVPASSFFIGERVSEGYGECVAQPLESVDWGYNGSISPDKHNGNADKQSIRNTFVLSGIADRLFKKFLLEKAVEYAGEESVKAKILGKATSLAAVSNMLLMLKKYSDSDKKKEFDLSLIEADCNKRFTDEILDEEKNEKGDIAHTIIHSVRDNKERIIDEFSDKYAISDFEYSGNYELNFLHAYLTQIKYRIREQKTEGGTR